MKDLRNLKGAQLLSKNEQQSINGGEGSCYPYYDYNTCIANCQGECKNFVSTNCYVCFDQNE